METPRYKIHGKLKPGVRALWYKYYPDDFQGIFWSHLRKEFNSTSAVLEIGAGSGEGDQQWFPIKGNAARYVGIDLDPRVMTNPHLNEAHVCDANNLPFESNTFDLVFHRMVAEHLADPLATLSEIQRVLKPGGVMMFETVNKYYYPMIAAAMTPHWFHRYYIGRFASGRKSIDVFPTVYKLNTSGAIKNLCRKSGFSETDVSYFSIPPGYLRFSKFLFLLGVGYERTVERILRKSRGIIIAKAVK